MRKNATSLSPTIEQKEEEDEQYESYKYIQKTDPRTFKKIMSFAKDMSCRLGDDSPELKKNFDIPDEKFNTLTEPQNLTRKITNKSRSSIFNQKGKTRFEKLMIQKLGYDWKKIYRNCVTYDKDAQGIIHIDDFIKSCEKNGISIIPLEQKQILKQFNLNNDLHDFDRYANLERNAHEYISFKKLSIALGLHKDSFNYLNKVQSLNKIQNLKKLKELYQINESRLEDNRLPLRKYMTKNNCSTADGLY